MAGRDTERPFPELGSAERTVLAPDVAATVVWLGSLGALLMRLVDEARRDGELALVGTSYELAHYLGSLLTGAALIGHSTDDTDWKRLYRRHGRRALGLLGAPQDPQPPAIPRRYRKRGKR
jgi:hypothetical protein